MCVCVRVCVSCSTVFVYVYNIMHILCTGVYMCALYSVNCLASDCVYIQQWFFVRLTCMYTYVAVLPWQCAMQLRRRNREYLYHFRSVYRWVQFCVHCDAALSSSLSQIASHVARQPFWPDSALPKHGLVPIDLCSVLHKCHLDDLYNQVSGVGFCALLTLSKLTWLQKRLFLLLWKGGVRAKCCMANQSINWSNDAD